MPDDLDALIREYGGLEGLARELGQLDQPAEPQEPGPRPRPRSIVLWLIGVVVSAVVAYLLVAH